MNEWADLLRAVAALLWPLVVLAALWFFRQEVKAGLGRVRRLRLPGGTELELDRRLDDLQERVGRNEEEVSRQSPQEVARGAAEEVRTLTAAAGVERPDLGEMAVEVLRLAEQSPLAALMSLAAYLERAVRQLLASLGAVAPDRIQPLPAALRQLQQMGKLHETVADTLKVFWEVRNKVVHGLSATDDEIMRAIDIGLSLLRVIEAIPHERNVVYDLVPVYSDPGCTQRREGVVGLILETTSAGGAILLRRIYPTTRDDYITGKAVAWEWDTSKVWGESWYKDPDTNEIKYAWTEAGQFIGRHLDEI